MKTIFWVGVSTLLFLNGCVKWDLEKIDIPSFNLVIDNDALQFGIDFDQKNTAIQLQDGSYFVVGKNQVGNVNIIKLDQFGNLQFNKSINLEGEGHAIIKKKNVDNRYILAVSNDLNSYLVEIDANAIILKVEHLNEQVNQRLGLLESMRTYELIQTNNGDLVITGILKQTIAKAGRQFLIRLDQDFNTIKINTFEEGNNGYFLEETDKGNILLFGKEDNRSSVKLITENGEIRWQNTNNNFFSGLPVNGLVWQDSILISINNDSNNRNSVRSFDLQNGQELRLNQLGAQQESLIFSGRTLLKNRKGNFNLLGVTPAVNGRSQLFLSEFDPENGRLVLQRTFEYEGDVIPMSVDQVERFGLFIFALRILDQKYSYIMIKMDEVGNLRN